MTQTLRFDPETLRRVETLYTSPDALRRRRRALELLELRPGESVLGDEAGVGGSP
jgi:hypothetical protein